MFSKKHVKTLIAQVVKEEVDKALAVSNKRRKEFKDNFAQVFTEADTPPAPPDPAAPAAPPSAGSDVPPDATSATPPGAPGAAPAGDPTAPGGAPDDPGATDETADDGTGDPGSGGGGFGGFGGGGGGGGVGDDTSASGDAADGTGEEPESPEPQGDPIELMVSGAQELLQQTNDPNMILKSLKGQIQTLFSEPEHALGLVKALYDTQDSILQSVAQRLYLFIKTARPL